MGRHTHCCGVELFVDAMAPENEGIFFSWRFVVGASTEGGCLARKV